MKTKTILEYPVPWNQKKLVSTDYGQAAFLLYQQADQARDIATSKKNIIKGAIVYAVAAVLILLILILTKDRGYVQLISTLTLFSMPFFFFFNFKHERKKHLKDKAYRKINRDFMLLLKSNPELKKILKGNSQGTGMKIAFKDTSKSIFDYNYFFSLEKEKQLKSIDGGRCFLALYMRAIKQQSCFGSKSILGLITINAIISFLIINILKLSPKDDGMLGIMLIFIIFLFSVVAEAAEGGERCREKYLGSEDCRKINAEFQKLLAEKDDLRVFLDDSIKKTNTN